uniref:Uncharacterized protein n=1 Tax=Aegilops tauschii subsp. strangulata TaxID=200361 RepID=A0A452Y780_AEGTS
MMRLSSRVETSNLQFVSGTALLLIQGFYPACIIFHFPLFGPFRVVVDGKVEVVIIVT